jgi:hypothetical protein
LMYYLRTCLLACAPSGVGGYLPKRSCLLLVLCCKWLQNDKGIFCTLVIIFSFRTGREPGIEVSLKDFPGIAQPFPIAPINYREKEKVSYAN